MQDELSRSPANPSRKCRTHASNQICGRIGDVGKHVRYLNPQSIQLAMQFALSVQEAERSLIIDTGSSISILQPGVSRSEVTTTGIKPYDVTEEVLDMTGRQSLSFMLGGKSFTIRFWSARFLMNLQAY